MERIAAAQVTTPDFTARMRHYECSQRSARHPDELLPVAYFHAVFTMPPAAAEIASQNKQTVYPLLFRTAAETLRRIAADPKHLGAEIGSSPCFTLGARPCSNTRMSIVSCAAVARRQTAPAGSPAGPAFSLAGGSR